MNLDDQVIGVTSATSVNATFISFAIPSDTVQKIVPQLITHGSYSHPWLGIGGIDNPNVCILAWVEKPMESL